MPHRSWEARRDADDRFYGRITLLVVAAIVLGLTGFAHVRDVRVAAMTVVVVQKIVWQLLKYRIAVGVTLDFAVD